MPIWQLTEVPVFPHPLTGSGEGILAVGGKITPEWLKIAYSYGIFPWNSEDDLIFWWFPDPRCVMRPGDVVISGSMRSLIRKEPFRITFDTVFDQVLLHCSSIPRKGQQGSWLYPELRASISQLHEEGIAHSVEVWQDDKLVGGLYGLAIGKVFFGESMFSLVSNASKYALIVLDSVLKEKGFWLLDCEENTAHLRRMGASLISAKGFHSILKKNRLVNQEAGKWVSMPRKVPLARR
jgi:leucyl/phenylalanyl-tRNA--protein transferase